MSEKKPKYIEDVGWRYDTEHNMTLRMKKHDYQTRCIYMLTLALADRSQPQLGHLCLDAQGKAVFTPSELGMAVIEDGNDEDWKDAAKLQRTKQTTNRTCRCLAVWFE